MSPRTSFRISLVGAAVLIALIVLAGRLPPLQPCGDLAKGYAPVIAFELVRSVPDMLAIFGLGEGECRTAIREGLNTATLFDSVIYIPAYGVFLVFALLGIASRGTGLGRTAVILTLASIAADYVENFAMSQLASAPDMESIWLAVLVAATNTKWLGLGLATFLGGLVLARRSVWGLLALVPCSLSLMCGLVAVANPTLAGPWLTTAMGIGWLALLAVAVVGAFGPSAKPAKASET